MGHGCERHHCGEMDTGLNLCDLLGTWGGDAPVVRKRVGFVDGVVGWGDTAPCYRFPKRGML